MEEVEMVRGRRGGRLLMKLNNKMEAGRRADDFLVTGPSDDVDQTLMVMRGRLKLSDAVKPAKNGGQATFLCMQ
eukprot:4446124-Pyramimonas_sp.AAC.1